MRRDLLSGLSQQQRPFLANMFLPNNRVLPGLTALDLLRGWKDDFLGKSLAGQYSTDLTGSSTIALVDDAHGGWVRLTSGASAGDHAYLFLGTIGGAYDTLDADYGWVQIARVRMNSISSILAGFGCYSAPTGHWIEAAMYTALGANWYVRSNDGTQNDEDSGVAVDTNWHWHMLDVYPITGGRQVDHYLDGVLTCSSTTNIPAAILTPFLFCYSIAAVSKSMDVDYWAVIPRNLA